MGSLKEHHHWQYAFKEKIEENIDEEAQMGDFGEFEDDEFFVNCETCDRDIEFGWSQPYRHGLILPVEFSDFDPLESWLDPKYVDVWQQRGRFRMGHIQP